MSVVNKLIFDTKITISKGYQIIRFIKPKNFIEESKLLGNRYRIYLPEEIQKNFLSENSTALSIIKLKSEINSNNKIMTQNNNENIHLNNTIDSLLCGQTYKELLPISSSNDDFIDFLIKEEVAYNIPDIDIKNIFDYYNFDNFKSNEEVSIDITRGEISYDLEQGNIEINDYVLLSDRKNNNKRKLKNNTIKNKSKIGMISEGKGIAPLFQIINNNCHLSWKDSFLSFIKPSKSFSLISYFNTIDEICFADDFFNFQYNGKINFYPVLKYPSDKFAFGRGIITKEEIDDYMPESTDKNAIMLISGSEEFCHDMNKLFEMTSYIEGQNLFFYNI